MGAHVEKRHESSPNVSFVDHLCVGGGSPSFGGAGCGTCGRKSTFERIGEFHLGPTGAMGWMHVSRNSMTREARQILITKVEPGCPAEGVLAEGDVILGVNGTPFSGDPRKALGRAIVNAETEREGGQLKLIRWRQLEGTKLRKGKEEAVVVKLPVLGTVAATTPYKCAKSARILDQAVAHLLEEKGLGKIWR